MESILHSLGLMVVTFVMAVVLAAAIEAIVEYFASPIFDNSQRLKPLKWIMMYVPIIPAVALAIYYKVDLIAFIGNGAAMLISPDGYEPLIQASVVGYVITGLLMSRGSNFVHQFVKDRLTDKTTAGRHASE